MPTVISVAPSPMGALFATGSGDMRARIWRLVTSPNDSMGYICISDSTALWLITYFFFYQQLRALG